MRPYLARNAYRRLLTARRSYPINSTTIATPCSCLHRPRIYAKSDDVRFTQRRTIFGVFQKPPPEVREPELELGYGTLLAFRSSQTEGIRAPPDPDLVAGFRQFFTEKSRRGRAVNSTQAFCALQLFRYLQGLKRPSDPRSNTEYLTLEDLKKARDVLLKAPSDSPEYHLELSRAIFTELRTRGHKATGSFNLLRDEADGTEHFRPPGYEPADFKQYLAALSQYGAATEALDILSAHWAVVQRKRLHLWHTVLSGLAAEGREDQLLRGAKEAEEAGYEYGALFREIMTVFYVKQANAEAAHEWFAKGFRSEVEDVSMATPGTFVALLDLQDSNHCDWIDEVFQTLCDANPSKAHWDVILQWAVRSLGHGIDDVRHMMETMVRHNQENIDVRPDISTINGLIEAAIQAQQPLLADRFLQLAGDMGLPRDSQTYVLQMTNQLQARDMAGAHKSFEHLQDIGTAHDEDLPVINRYIKALCSQKSFDLERVIFVLGTVERRRVAVEPETVAVLCMAFLKRDLQYEVIDTLSIHTFQYSLEERKVVRSAFINYCLTPQLSTARAWDVYSLVRQFFPETDATERSELMNAFFKRKRADLASYIFGHMRAHSNAAIQPTQDVYLQCLSGLGRCPDLASLRLVHNMLKMDTSISMDTRVYTALMIAYAACGDPTRALDFWHDISNSVEGPSYNSLAAVFWVCELVPFGDKTARSIWAKLQRMEVDVPQEVYGAYCGAIAGQGEVAEVEQLLSGMEASIGLTPDVLTLGIVYNALPGQQLAEDFKGWASAEFPEVWSDLEKQGQKMNADGMMHFKIKRVLKP